MEIWSLRARDMIDGLRLTFSAHVREALVRPACVSCGLPLSHPKCPSIGLSRSFGAMLLDMAIGMALICPRLFGCCTSDYASGD